jgi:hypothetical protein
LGQLQNSDYERGIGMRSNVPRISNPPQSFYMGRSILFEETTWYVTHGWNYVGYFNQTIPYIVIPERSAEASKSIHALEDLFDIV